MIFLISWSKNAILDSIFFSLGLHILVRLYAYDPTANYRYLLQLEMHARLISAMKFYLLTYLCRKRIGYAEYPLNEPNHRTVPKSDWQMHFIFAKSVYTMYFNVSVLL